MSDSVAEEPHISFAGWLVELKGLDFQGAFSLFS